MNLFMDNPFRWHYERTVRDLVIPEEGVVIDDAGPIEEAQVCIIHSGIYKARAEGVSDKEENLTIGVVIKIFDSTNSL